VNESNFVVTVGYRRALTSTKLIVPITVSIAELCVTPICLDKATAYAATSGGPGICEWLSVGRLDLTTAAVPVVFHVHR